jgi:hypothetical protein
MINDELQASNLITSYFYWHELQNRASLGIMMNKVPLKINLSPSQALLGTE